MLVDLEAELVAFFEVLIRIASALTEDDNEASTEEVVSAEYIVVFANLTELAELEATLPELLAGVLEVPLKDPATIDVVLEVALLEEAEAMLEVVSEEVEMEEGVSLEVELEDVLLEEAASLGVALEEVGLLEVALEEVGLLEVALEEVGLLEVALEEVGLLEVALEEVGLLEVVVLEEVAPRVVTDLLEEVEADETTEDAVWPAVLAGFIVVDVEELVVPDDIVVVYPCATAGIILDETVETVCDVLEVDEDEDEDEDEYEETALISGSTSSANSPK